MARKVRAAHLDGLNTMTSRFLRLLTQNNERSPVLSHDQTESIIQPRVTHLVGSIDRIVARHGRQRRKRVLRVRAFASRLRDQCAARGGASVMFLIRLAQCLQLTVTHPAFILTYDLIWSKK